MAFFDPESGSHHEDSDGGQTTWVVKMRAKLLDLERTIGKLLESFQNHDEKTKSLEQSLTQITQTCDGTLVEFREATTLCLDTTPLANSTKEKLKLLEYLLKLKGEKPRRHHQLA